MLIQELLRMNVSISRDHYFHEIKLKYSNKGSSQVDVHCTYRCLPGTDRCSLYIPSYIDIKIAQGWIWIFCVILRFLLKGSKIVTLTNVCNEVTMSPYCLTLHHIIAFLLHHFILLIWCQGYLKNLQKIIKILQNHIHSIYTRNSWKTIIIIISSCP